MKCVAVSFWVWYWSKKVKLENKPCNLHLGILHVSIWIWVLPKVDPVTRNWFQEVYLGDGMMERGERHRKERKANKRCGHGQVTAVGNWGSLLLGMLWVTVQITLHISPTPQGGRCCRATNSCPFLLRVALEESAFRCLPAGHHWARLSLGTGNQWHMLQ